MIPNEFVAPEVVDGKGRRYTYRWLEAQRLAVERYLVLIYCDNSDYTLKDVANIMHCDEETVRLVLEENGVEIRPRIRGFSSIPRLTHYNREAMNLWHLHYNKGWSIYRLRRHFHELTEQAILQIIECPEAQWSRYTLNKTVEKVAKITNRKFDRRIVNRPRGKRFAKD